MGTFTWGGQLGQTWLHRIALRLFYDICMGQLAVLHIDRTLWLRQHSIGYGSGRLHGMVWDGIVGGVSVPCEGRVMIHESVRKVMIHESVRKGRFY
jgi:hypothetical protein